MPKIVLSRISKKQKMCARTKSMEEKKPKKAEVTEGYNPFAEEGQIKDGGNESVGFEEFYETSDSDNLSPVLPEPFMGDESYHASQDDQASEDELSDPTEEEDTIEEETKALEKEDKERRKIKRDMKMIVNQYKKERIYKYIHRQIRDIKKRNEMVMQLIALAKKLENN